MNKINLVLTALISLGGCSVHHAMSQAGPANLTGIGVGTPRQAIITQLGAPASTEITKEGLKQDIFQFQSGRSEGSRARVVLYLAADIFTLGISEIVFWPIESVYGEAADCTGITIYNDDSITQSWQLTSRKMDTQHMRC